MWFYLTIHVSRFYFCHINVWTHLSLNNLASCLSWSLYFNLWKTVGVGIPLIPVLLESRPMTCFGQDCLFMHACFSWLANRHVMNSFNYMLSMLFCFKLSCSGSVSRWMNDLSLHRGILLFWWMTNCFIQVNSPPSDLRLGHRVRTDNKWECYQTYTRKGNAIRGVNVVE